MGVYKGLLTHTSFWPEIRARHHSHAQIILDFADDLDGVVELEVGVLRVENISWKILENRISCPSA